jgi:hypothetical protein
MSLCRIDLDWGDGTYPFCLPLAQLEELQALCDAGPMVIADRLRHGQWRTQDVHQTLRLGLVGGGMEPVRALRLCKLYVLDRPIGESVVPALAVLNAAIFGKPEEPVGKSPARRKPAGRRAARASSISASSTASEP